MLKITIPAVELFDNVKQEFVTTKETTVTLEHSLLSISKWEAKYKRPFLSDGPKTKNEIADYISCMCLDKNVDHLIFENVSKENIDAIMAYINDPMTATTIKDMSESKTGSREFLTNELIYFYMTAFNIPFECQKWHLNRLLVLIRIANAKNGGNKKMGRKDITDQNRSLNAARRAKLHSRG